MPPPRENGRWTYWTCGQMQGGECKPVSECSARIKAEMPDSECKWFEKNMPEWLDFCTVTCKNIHFPECGPVHKRVFSFDDSDWPWEEGEYEEHGHYTGHLNDLRRTDVARLFCGVGDPKPYNWEFTGWPHWWDWYSPSRSGPKYPATYFLDSDSDIKKNIPFPPINSYTRWKCVFQLNQNSREYPRPLVRDCWAKRGLPEPEDPKCASPYHQTTFPFDTSSWPDTSLDKFCEEGNLVPNPNFSFVGNRPPFPSAGESTRWRCQLGSNIHNCVAHRDAPEDPKCASPYDGETFSLETSSWPDGVGLDKFCEEGDLATYSGFNFVGGRPPFPGEGGTTRWRCEVNGDDVECSASREMVDPELAYDVLRGFFVVDGEIDIKFVDENKDIRDGLKVVGGLFGTGSSSGEPSIRLGRSLQLIDNLENPTVIIHHDARYLDIGRKIFGDSFGGGHIRDIGLKE